MRGPYLSTLSRCGDGQGFDFAIQRALSQSAVSAWVCLILVESAKPGVTLGRKVKKPDIRLCHARPKKPAQPWLQIGPSTGGGRFIW